LKSFEPDLKLLGLAKQNDSTLVAPFESVLDLTWQPDPIVFCKKGNTLSRNFCQKTQQRNAPPPGL